MALTIAITRTERMGRMKYVTGTIAFDSSYPTGGESLTAANVNLNVIKDLSAQPSGGLIFSYDMTNKKLLAYQPTGGGGTNPTTLQAPKVSGGAASASAVDATTPTIVPGIAKECANTADLSAITGVPFRAWGL